MDLTQLANLGEFIGGVAVLVTLIYLALQVRQGNKLERSNAHHAYTDKFDRILFQPMRDSEFMGLLQRAYRDFQSLDTKEQGAVNAQLGALDAPFRNWKALFNLELMGQRQSVQEAWKVFRPGYEEEFRALMDPYVQA